MEGSRVDLAAIITIIGAGISYLVCRSRRIRRYNGVDLQADEAWQRLEDAMRQIVSAVRKQVCFRSMAQ